jgi:transcriptional regulator with XRE-family HTH domain
MKTFKRKNLSGVALVRKQLHFTQELMALYLGVSLSTIKLAELGERSLPTNVLVKLAAIQMQLEANSTKKEFKTMHPLENSFQSSFNRECREFFKNEEKCRHLKAILEHKLRVIQQDYQSVRNKVELIERIIAEKKDDLPQVQTWLTQKELAARALKKCGMAQQILVSKGIEFLEGEIILYTKIKESITAALPDFFNDSHNLIL